VASESGLFPTMYLRVFVSQRAATPDARLSLRVEGMDAASLIRGKVLVFEVEGKEGWQYVGSVVGGRAGDGPSPWIPAGGGGAFVTLEGYPGTMPLDFDVPPVPPGDYRVRLDLIHPDAEIGDIRQRTATLYAPLRVLGPSDASA
jgi:hypothetical protein